MASEKKIAANRLNGRKSHGPNNTTSTRYNATKHGLLANGVTALDDAAGYQKLLQDLIKEKNPVGPTEMFLVESVALDMVRARRARLLEAQYITAVLNPPVTMGAVLGDLSLVDPGLPAAIDASSAQKLVNVFQRYESVFVTRFLRTLHELERLQRVRLGEKLPAPAALDVTIHTEDSPNAPDVSDHPEILPNEEKSRKNPFALP